ncbi:MAG: methionine--tRNA ligase, partial [Clostridia bacterium]|nr:methionine--tRNA ligase [Clostridia bacterium]
LLKLTLDLAGNTRTIVSGIAKSYKPEDMVGKNVIVIANLKPAKIRGVESHGMLLAASDGDDILVCTTDGEIESGTAVS